MRARSRTPVQLVHDITNHHAYLRHRLRAQIGTDIRIPRGYLEKIVRTLGYLLACQPALEAEPRYSFDAGRER